MRTTTAIALALALAACHASQPADKADQKHGAIFTGPQPTAITLGSGSNENVSLLANNASPGAIVRLTPNASGSTLGGLALAAAQDGDIFILRDESTTVPITLNNQDAGSLAVNQFLLTGAANVVLPPLSSVMIERDATNNAWEMAPGFINGPTFNGKTAVAGHLINTGGAAITFPSCGTGPVCNSTTCTDNAGTFTTGTTATACTINFASAWAAEPTCVVVPSGTTTLPTCTVSTTQIVCSADVASTKYKYLCIGS